MDISYYVDRTRFQLTSGILECELDDSALKSVVYIALQELNRYYDSTKLMSAPAEKCIDMAPLEEENGVEINTVTAILRSTATGMESSTENTKSNSDPALISQWNLANNYYNFGTNRWTYNYLVYNTTQQLSNTLSTDLAFRYDKPEKKLYVNYNTNPGSHITIEYIPALRTADDVQGDYWIDIFSELILAHAKCAVGRVRTRYKQSGGLWEGDGDAILAEGNQELTNIRERLHTKSNVTFPID